MGKAAGRRACSEKISPRHVPMMSRAIYQSCPADAVPGMSWLCDRMVCDCNKGCVLLGGRQEQPIELICNFFHGLMSLKSLRVISRDIHFHGMHVPPPTRSKEHVLGGPSQV